MNKKTKAFLYNFLGFAVFYIPTLLIAQSIFDLQGFLGSLIAFVVSLILSPKFRFLNTKDGEAIFMRWIFIKGIKEIK